jgi:ATP synthase protein I
MSDRNPKDNPWRAAALTSAIGIDLAVCLGAGYWLGGLLSGGSMTWSILGLVIGLAVAVVSIYLMIKTTGGL